MLSIATFATSLLLSTLVAAQAPTTNFSSTDISQLLSGQYAKTLSIRNDWCTAQYGVCSSLCAGVASLNNCYGSNLTWTCTCASNNSSPALQYYEDSIIWNICSTDLGDCLTQNAMDSAAQTACKSKYICGTLNATDAASSPSSSSSSAASSATASSTSAASQSGSATASTTPSASSTASASSFAIKIGQDYGVGILAASFMALAGLFL
ncbi:hypothetical protein MMC25_003876 [Agyrium rufum]|nr:hypothetical protein [Agyrium rufum]